MIRNLFGSVKTFLMLRNHGSVRQAASCKQKSNYGIVPSLTNPEASLERPISTDLFEVFLRSCDRALLLSSQFLKE